MATTFTYKLTGTSPADRLNDLAQAFVENLFNRVITRSPVKTGRFVSNWNFSRGGADISTRAEISGKEEKRGELMAFAQTVRAGDVVNMANGLPYAYRLEVEHTSLQAPSGMISVTLLEAEDALAEAKLKVGL